MTAALAIEALEAGYEPGLPIVRGASLAVQPGEIVAILGPNGAGKSTLVKAVAGLVPVSAGRVLLHGQDITRVPAHRLVFEGLAFVPQTENIFANLSIAENLELAAALLRADRRERLDPVYAMFPDLARQRTLRAGRLSGGQRQMLAVARALIARPRVLVLDEPSAGLSPKLVARGAGAAAQRARQRRHGAAGGAEREGRAGRGRPRRGAGRRPRAHRRAAAPSCWTTRASPSCTWAATQRRHAADTTERPPLMLQILADGLVIGSVMSLGAIGLSLTFSILRFSNFGHGELLAWGAYFAFTALARVHRLRRLPGTPIGAVLVRLAAAGGAGGVGAC